MPSTLIRFQEEPSGASPEGGNLSSMGATLTLRGVLQRPSLNRNRDIFVTPAAQNRPPSSNTPSLARRPAFDIFGPQPLNTPSASSSTSTPSTTRRADGPTEGVPGPNSTQPPEGTGVGPLALQLQVSDFPGGLDLNDVTGVSLGCTVDYETGQFELRTVDIVPGPSTLIAYPTTSNHTIRGCSFTNYITVVRREGLLRRRRGAYSLYDVSQRPAWRCR